MEIVQQKLAWVMAMAAMLILVYKLNLRRAGISRSAINKVRAGLILNMAGALACVVYRVGFTSGSVPHSGFAVIVETMGGYVLGWTLVLWGLIQSLGSFFDPKGDLKSDLAVGRLSKSLSSSLLNGNGPNRIMEELAADLLQVLGADAVTLHRLDEAGHLRLSYSVGIDPASRNLIRMPEGDEDIYMACLKTGRPVIADNPFEIAAGKRLELSKGLAWSALCIPTAFSGETYGLVAAYRHVGRAFRDDDCEMLRIAGEGLGLALWRQYNDDARRIEARYREIVSLARRYFITEKSLASAMIKTAKLIHGHIPFERVKLEVMGNGKPHYLDFNLSTGGVVSIGSGYFSKEYHPSFHTDARPSPGSKRPSGSRQKRNELEYRYPVCDGDDRIAVLTIEVITGSHESDNLAMLGNALCQEIGDYLRRERLASQAERTGHRIGAFKLLAELAQGEGSLSQSLDNVASAVIDLMPATICRIFLVDHGQRILKSAGLAVARGLELPPPAEANLVLDDTDLCREAIDTGTVVKFDLDFDGTGTSAQVCARLMTQGVRRGACLPLKAANQVAGLLLVGDARRTSRSQTETEDTFFLSAVAELISVVLSMRGCDSEQSRASAGMGRLTLKNRQMQVRSPDEDASISDRSRINGPLAGILASCEYLQSCPPEDISEVGRFIDIIQRNAVRIHSLTSEPGRA